MGKNLMRSAECGIAMEVRSTAHPSSYIPHSEFRIPHSRVRIVAMSYQPLLFDLRDGIAFITINRPDKLNALNDQVVVELADAAERVAAEEAIKGVILSGAGQKAFVAGAGNSGPAQQGPFGGEGAGPAGPGVVRGGWGRRETAQPAAAGDAPVARGADG